jgi:hypothetical protein
MLRQIWQYALDMAGPGDHLPASPEPKVSAEEITLKKEEQKKARKAKRKRHHDNRASAKADMKAKEVMKEAGKPERYDTASGVSSDTGLTPAQSGAVVEGADIAHGHASKFQKGTADDEVERYTSQFSALSVERTEEEQEEETEDFASACDTMESKEDQTGAAEVSVTGFATQAVGILRRTDGVDSGPHMSMMAESAPVLNTGHDVDGSASSAVDARKPVSNAVIISESAKFGTEPNVNDQDNLFEGPSFAMLQGSEPSMMSELEDDKNLGSDVRFAAATRHNIGYTQPSILSTPRENTEHFAPGRPWHPSTDISEPNLGFDQSIRITNLEKTLASSIADIRMVETDVARLGARVERLYETMIGLEHDFRTLREEFRGPSRHNSFPIISGSRPVEPQQHLVQFGRSPTQDYDDPFLRTPHSGPFDQVIVNSSGPYPASIRSSGVRRQYGPIGGHRFRESGAPSPHIRVSLPAHQTAVNTPPLTIYATPRAHISGLPEDRTARQTSINRNWRDDKIENTHAVTPTHVQHHVRPQEHDARETPIGGITTSNDGGGHIRRNINFRYNPDIENYP